MAKILVVDDMATIRRIVKAVLTGLGHTVEEADSGSAAFARLPGADYDLVVSDWNMPKGTGSDLVRAMKAHSEFGRIPVIMLTAEADRARIVEMAQMGVSGYILKPFKPETLEKAVKKLLA